VAWRRDCNEVSPYGSLKGHSPREYADAAARLYWPAMLGLGKAIASQYLVSLAGGVSREVSILQQTTRRRE
jgi:hypothetical protein